MFVIYKGIESIRILLNIKAPLLIALGLALLAWAYYAADGFGPMLAKPSAFAAGGPKAGQFWPFFFPSLTANVGFWATLSLNIPDFSRYAYSQRDQVLGQALGLPTTMALFSFIGVAVTSATAVIYGETIWDPVVVLSKFTNPLVLVRGDALALHRHAGDEHRRQRRQPGQRLRPPLAAEDFVPHRRLHHGADRHPDAAVETGRRSDRLHFPLAGRVLGAAGRGRRRV